MKKIWVLSLLFFIGSFAYGLDVSFDFDVHSSGPYFYACNAGLMHPVPVHRQVCYRTGSTAAHPIACTPGSSNCICTGYLGANKLDFMTYQTASFQGTTYSSLQKKIAGISSYQQILHNNQLGTRIESLNFHFSSERYGARFFVDLCYHGPQIEFYAHHIRPHFYTMARAYVTAYPSSSAPDRYPYIARLYTRARMVCDTQGHGHYRYARDEHGHYDTMHHEANIGGYSYGNGFYLTSPYYYFGYSYSRYYWNHRLITGYGPRYCVIRYEFSETNVDFLRKWQRKSARIRVDGQVEQR